MIRVDPFVARDMAIIDMQPSQALPDAADKQQLGRQLSASGDCFTISDDRRILFCGGAQKVHDQYIQIWAVFARDLSAAEKIAVAKRARRWFAFSRCRRIEAQVRADDIPARRFAEWLGMERESRSRAAAFDGSDMLILAKIRNDDRGA